MIVEHNVRVPMRDGLDLAANVFRPQKPGKYPVIIAFTGFNKDSLWASRVGASKSLEAYEPTNTAQPDLLLGTAFETEEPSFWVPYGYVVILVDGRGVYSSPGARLPAGFSTLGGALEDPILRQGLWMRDQYDAIEWAAAQSWSNGNVGLSGTSLMGFSQWRVAGLKPPHLKAIAPWEAMTDFRRGTIFPGGIPQVGFGPKPAPVVTPAWPAPAHEQLPSPVELPEDEFLRQITIPTLMNGAWNSTGVHTLGTFRAWRWISSSDKWLYTTGQDEWAVQYDTDARAFRKMFFDHFLKSTDDRILEVPRVRLEVQDNVGISHVRYEDEFPIARTQYKTLYLDANSHALSFDKVAASQVIYESTKGQATFLYKFGEDTEITGNMSLKLWVSAEQTDDMDIFVAVTKVDANGQPVKFEPTMGFLRLSLRELDPKRSTPYIPYQKSVVGAGSKVKPGTIVHASVEIPPTSYMFHKGESLRLDIAGNDSVQNVTGVPLVTGTFKFTSLNAGNNTIYTGGDHDSSLAIPVVPAKATRGNR
jgi:predicted acyl esterase